MNMEANELRIGNYAYSDGVIVKLDGRSVFDAHSKELGFNGRSYEPIPLTPELLEKCGFVKERTSSQSWFWYLGKTRFQYRVTRGDIVCKGFEISQPITSLHQLQNLYYALTGSEIEVNL